jgi:hypothetical protein
MHGQSQVLAIRQLKQLDDSSVQKHFGWGDFPIKIAFFEFCPNNHGCFDGFMHTRWPGGCWNNSNWTRRKKSKPSRRGSRPRSGC